MERRRDLDRRDHLERWRQSVPIGVNFATFAPGDELRCPRTVTTPAGGTTICAGYLGDAEAAVVVYSVRRTDRVPGLLSCFVRQRCPRCEGYYRVCAPAEQIKGAA